MNIRIFDNEGRSIDRYTVFIDGGVFGMSHNPNSPQGFNQFCCTVSEVGNEKRYTRLGKEITIEDVPEEVQIAIKEREEQ